MAMTTRHRIVVLLVSFFPFKCYKRRQEMCEFNIKITIVQLLRFSIVSAKSKFHSPRRGYLSPGNSIVLEIETALLFISVTNSCRFWGLLVEIQAGFQEALPG